VDYSVVNGGTDKICERYGGTAALAAALRASGSYSEEEAVAAIVVAAVRRGSTSTYNVDFHAAKLVLDAWSAVRNTPSSSTTKKQKKLRNCKSLNLLHLCQNLGL
jgi:hypothetical protein